MIDTSPNSNLKDTPLHTIFNRVNSKDRKSVKEVAFAIGNINNELAKQHLIVEPETSREDISKIIFQKMDSRESVVEKSNLNIFLSKYRVKQVEQIQAAKNILDNQVQNNGRDDMDFLQ